MNILLWAVRSLHLFSVVVWFGGIMYQAVVVLPGTGGSLLDRSTVRLLRRFLPFLWMSIATILVTGVGLMLFDPRFVFLGYTDRWSITLGLKHLAFAIMVFFSFGYGRMITRFDETIADQQGDEGMQEAKLYSERILQFGRINVALGILAILLAASL